jgi:hypothetical protein
MNSLYMTNISYLLMTLDYVHRVTYFHLNSESLVSGRLEKRKTLHTSGSIPVSRAELPNTPIPLDLLNLPPYRVLEYESANGSRDSCINTFIV